MKFWCPNFLELSGPFQACNRDCLTLDVCSILCKLCYDIQMFVVPLGMQDLLESLSLTLLLSAVSISYMYHMTIV